MQIREPPCETPYTLLLLFFRSAMTRFGRHAPEIRIQSAAEATSAARSIVYAGAEPVEIVVDVFYPFQVMFGKRKAMRFRKMILNSLEIFRVKCVAGESLPVCRKDFLNTGLGSESFRPFT